MINRKAGLFAVGKEVMPKERFEPVRARPGAIGKRSHALSHHLRRAIHL